MFAEAQHFFEKHKKKNKKNAEAISVPGFRVLVPFRRSPALSSSCIFYRFWTHVGPNIAKNVGKREQKKNAKQNITLGFGDFSENCEAWFSKSGAWF